MPAFYSDNDNPYKVAFKAQMYREFYKASAIHFLSKVGNSLSLLTASQVSLWDLAPTRLKTNRFAESCLTKATQLSEMRFIPSYRTLAFALPALAAFNFALDMINIKCFKGENKRIESIRDTTNQIDKWILIVFLTRVSLISFASIENWKQRIGGIAFTLFFRVSLERLLDRALPKNVVFSSSYLFTPLVAHAASQLSSRLSWLSQSVTLAATTLASIVRIFKYENTPSKD